MVRYDGLGDRRGPVVATAMGRAVRPCRTGPIVPPLVLGEGLRRGDGSLMKSGESRYGLPVIHEGHYSRHRAWA